MDRDRHDRNSRYRTRKRQRLLIGSTESLRTGQEKRRPPVAGESPIPSGGLCLSRRDGPDVGGELHEAAGLARNALYLLRPDAYVALADASGAPDALDRHHADRGIRTFAAPR
jgi:hypothetical protein